MIVVQFRVNMLANLVINIYRLMDRQMFAFVDKKAMIMLWGSRCWQYARLNLFKFIHSSPIC